MTRLMGVSGAESLNVAASIFMGQTEAPLTIRPFLPDLDAIGIDDGDDERHGACVGRDHGGLYRVRDRGETSAGAVIMTAPGTILLAKMLVPETEVPKTAGEWRWRSWRRTGMRWARLRAGQPTG